MSSSPVVRAALVGAALLGCSACTGGDAAEPESTAPASSGTSSSAPAASSAPATSSEAPSTESPSGSTDSGSADPSEAAAEPSVHVLPAGPQEETPEVPQPPSDWEETEKRVQAMAAGVEPGAEDAGQATRGLVSSTSGVGTYSEPVPKDVDGVVVTCGGEGTGRLLNTADEAVMFSCGAIVDTPLRSADRTITIEVEGDSYWILTFYEEEPTAR